MQSNVARVIVAVPACNEAERIDACLGALAFQRDEWGATLPSSLYKILLFANNCSDRTADIARDFAAQVPVSIEIIEERLSAAQSSAGLARKRAMDLASDRLSSNGVILTTDADSIVSPTWVSAALAAIDDGADCVAGYVDGHPLESTRLGLRFVERGRLEEAYHAAISRISSIFDPRAHDPWPNHRVSSGACLGITLKAYRKIGGLPPLACGEDAALTLAVECHAMKVRHSLRMTVMTSCRTDGRAKGGAAEAIRFRASHPDAFCDEDMEPVYWLVRRNWLKGRLRAAFRSAHFNDVLAQSGVELDAASLRTLGEAANHQCFEHFWLQFIAASPLLAHFRTLRPSELPRELARATVLCARENLLRDSIVLFLQEPSRLETYLDWVPIKEGLLSTSSLPTPANTSKGALVEPRVL
jgi:cellulose synthase/poly-beta-1,6-N-acetylglucosamine synthase-like glycosyltransferase